MRKIGYLFASMMPLGSTIVRQKQVPVVTLKNMNEHLGSLVKILGTSKAILFTFWKSTDGNCYENRGSSVEVHEQTMDICNLHILNLRDSSPSHSPGIHSHYYSNHSHIKVGFGLILNVTLSKYFL